MSNHRPKRPALRTTLVDFAGDPVSIGSGGISSSVDIVAGSAIIGKVGIDQTTPGTTNGVEVNAALPAGNNNIGNVDVVTLPGVDVDSLPADVLAGGPDQTLDYDTGGGSEPTPTIGIVIPASGGPQAAGHAANPIHVTSITLPTGAATSAKQDTGNTSVASIDTKTPALGQAISGSSVPVVLPAAQITTLTPPAAITGFGTETTAAAALATLGATSGAAVITDANGTIQQYLRGLVKLLITAGTIVLGSGANLIGFVGGKPTYAAKATITCTLTSVANAAGRESTVIDNTTNRYRDVRIRVITKGQAGSTAMLNVYVYTALGDTTYAGGATGSDAAFTPTVRGDRFLGAVLMNTTSAVSGEFQLSDIFATMPSKWGLAFLNSSGGTLSATGGDHVIEYEGIN